ncbi:tripartite tricarboxylate transporter TctB family protein [Tianweitania sediminis]|jgi:putative tricarboxylic transport membrane protein|uniref:Tripartite tricarboxylate transporter TctB family protein n=1 Tax=Tianweitania sediminis TaxID=1502156 RepID=A0A8J7R0W1_9HYPH|nr:tripartite tricarboxylate transporter TctB family protein [Tianweitania sediminis]MBP0440528.1 tripartite tricarboxylate transporter TctB family protein [Tianweitania sediminis]HEV7418077.1 tripartite tricarboxylate transporter TctB family protein [Tianweitania sediminis]
MSLEAEQPVARRPDRAALLIALVLAVVGLAIGWSTLQAGGVAAYTPVGPKTVPFIVAACLIGLALWTAVEAWRGNFPEREEQQTAPILWVVGGLIVQMLTIKTIGFSLATGLLFAATAFAFNERRLWLTLPFGIVFSFAVWFIFARGLQLSLPAGWLERLV